MIHLYPVDEQLPGGQVTSSCGYLCSFPSIIPDTSSAGGLVVTVGFTHVDTRAVKTLLLGTSLYMSECGAVYHRAVFFRISTGKQSLVSQ